MTKPPALDDDIRTRVTGQTESEDDQKRDDAAEGKPAEEPTGDTVTNSDGSVPPHQQFESDLSRLRELRPDSDDDDASDDAASEGATADDTTDPPDEDATDQELVGGGDQTDVNLDDRSAADQNIDVGVVVSGDGVEVSGDDEQSAQGDPVSPANRPDMPDPLIAQDGPPPIDPDGGSFTNVGTAGWDPGVDGDGSAVLGDIIDSGLRAAHSGDLSVDDLGFGKGADSEPAGQLDTDASPAPDGFAVGDPVAARDLGGFDGKPGTGLEPVDGPALEVDTIEADGRGLDESGDAPLLGRSDPKSGEDAGPDRDPGFDIG